MNDFLEDTEPTTQIVQKTFFQTTKGKSILVTTLGLISFLILLVGLNYFDIIYSSKLSFLPKRSVTNLTSAPVKVTLIPQTFGFKAGDLTLGCPVDSSFCNSQKLVTVKNEDVVVYKAPAQSSILNLVTAQTLENIAYLTNEKTGKKYFYESVVSRDGASCYTVAYTLPSDTEFTDFLKYTKLEKNIPIAKLGLGTFEIESEEANVVIQVRNTPQDPGVPCSLIKKTPEFFNSF